MPDFLFFSMICSVLTDAQAYPFSYHLLALYEKVNYIARAALEMQINPLSGAEASSNAILREVTYLVKVILASISKKYETDHQEVKFYTCHFTYNTIYVFWI